MALVIFDYDGVLADTLQDLLRFGQHACDELGISHKVTKEDLSNLEVMSFSTYGRACEVPEHQIDDFVRICLNLFAEKKSPPAIFTGLSDVVRQLAINNPIVIVTTNSTQNVMAFLAEHGLEHCVQAVYGLDQPGSKAQKIAMARERFLADPKQELAFIVGDSLSDLRAAKETATASIAVTWGHQSLEHLLHGEPDHVVSVPADLVRVIEK